MLKACRTLFGAEVWLDRRFLFYLQHDGAKAAFRKRVKETHPDRFPSEPQIQRRQSEQFQAVTRAYDLIADFLKKRDHSVRPPQGATKPAASPHASSHRHRASADTGSRRGPLPGRTYQIGLFLYAQGLIPYRALIEALVWQRRQRPTIGETARRWGWLSDAQIRSILNHRSPHHLFGEKGVELGLLTPFQVRTLLFYQRHHHRRLGQYFVEQGLLTGEQLDELVRELDAHNARVHAMHRRAGA